ncbi:dihydroorotase [Rhodospirillaceae bacterium]|nr:dihydroorotase [Rhodospirillaceae bacterium]
MGKKIFKNARLLDPESKLDAMGSVLIDNGVILDVGPNVFVDAMQDDIEVIDCSGVCLCPGLIDMRVATGEPGNEHLETFESVSNSAAAGGITSIICLPNTDPTIDDVALLEFVERRGAEVDLISVRSYAAATKGTLGLEMSEVGLLYQAGALGFTDGHKAIHDAMLMRRLLSYATVFNTMVIQHPEMIDLVGEGVMSEGVVATELGLNGIPPEAEVMLIERDLRLVEMTGGTYHVSRVTTAASVEAISRAKSKGLPVSCDTTPHYFTLNEEAVRGYRTFAKVSPPLRSEADRQAIVEGISSGVIDAIVSDHSPRDQDSKRLPFNQASFGVVGLETLLPVTLEKVYENSISLLDALAPLTCNPAKLLGLKEGRLQKKYPANFVLFDLDSPFEINGDTFRSKCKNSPFNGKKVNASVLKTVRGGNIVFDINNSRVD